MKRKTLKIDIIIILVLILAVAGIVLGIVFGKSMDENSVSDEKLWKGDSLSYTDFNGKVIGIITGSSFEPMTFETFPDSTYAYFDTITDMIEALRQKKIDGFLHDEPVLFMATLTNPDISYFSDYISRSEYCFCFRKHDTKSDKIRRQFNEMVAELKADGTGATNLVGVFTGGDCESGPATVIKAIAAGKVAAANIDEFLGFHHEITVDVEIPEQKHLDLIPCGRVNLGEKESWERRNNFEGIEFTMSDEEAKQEADRCLRCDRNGCGVLRGGRQFSW